MKKIYLLLVLLTTNLISAQIFQDTKGELSVSGSGTASYKVPIALPPGIKDVAPQLALVYGGSSVQGMAGMGWNMVGISSISRISSRIDLDGTIDAVDFDNLDRLALDGQRLIEKTGVYGAAGTTYQTENYSNLKIESSSNFDYTIMTRDSEPCFTITFPDGTQAFYGGTPDSRGIMEWMINRWIDPQGNYIDYTYESEDNAVRITQISWGKNLNSASTYTNLIQFYYKARTRAEFAYLAGEKIATTKILSYITVRTGGTLFRKYTLEHETLSGNYQRVKSITESNEIGEKANPIVFDYDTSDDGFSEFQYYNSPSGALLGDVKLSGDFDGDGQQDFVTKDKVYLNPIGNNNTWTGLNFSLGDSKCFTATTLTSIFNPFPPYSPKYNLNQFQSIVKVEESSNSIAFNTYNLVTQVPYLPGVYLNNTKSISFNNSGTYTGCNGCIGCSVYDNSGTIIGLTGGTYKKETNLYFEGDYNGDGISEVLIKRAIDEKINTKKYYNYSGRNYYCGDEEVTNNGFEYYLVNLDPSNPISEPIKLSIQSSSESKDYIADFNGDGKADVLIINSDKTYKIVSFKQLKVAPWVEIEILTKDIFVPGIFAEYDKDKQLVFGDFNGDSKTDIMIPEANDSSNWFLYQATGTGFEKIAYPNFEWYEPQGDKGPASKHRLKFRNYRSADLDKDGKSDFVVSEYETWCVADIVSNWEKCNRNGIGYLHLKRNTGSIDTKPVFSERITTSVSTSGADYDKSPPIQLLIGDYKNHQANFNFAFIQGTQIWKGNFNKDLSRDATLVKVTEAAGAITQTLSYKPLVPSSGLETANDVYYSSHRNNSPTPLESYPYTELIKAPTMNVVDKITVTGAGQTKSQLFKYFGLVTHAQGYGVLGFRKMARSSWYTDANPDKIWSCSQMNPLLLGQKIFEWSYSGDNHLANFRSFSIDDTESTVLGTTKNTYTTSFLANGVKNIVPFTSEKKDFLTGLTDKTEFFYDSYWNISRMLATNAVGTKENRNLVYDNPDGVGKLYALGRIVQTNQTLSAYGDTFTTEEKFTYHPTATNLVQQSHKKGHNTDYISTNYVYDVFGNLTEKTISAPALTSLTIKDKYDNNGRFVLQKTDHELFVTKFTYNKLGQVLTSTSPLAVKNTTTYDKWGKITTNVITGGSDAALTTTTTYSRFADGGFSVTSTKSNTNEVSRSFQDVFGRTTKSTTKGFAVDSWISKSTEYDFLGRKTSESEPYFDSNPTTAIGSGTKWNTVDYDYLSRPESQTSYNGRTQTILYDGLSTTTIDGPKTMKVTVDANGNKTQLLDNSETLSYTYYANGTPKQTLYGNHSIDTQFDGWGRKIYMLDPSVSTTPYTYTYTDFGEILTETTPTGVTTFNYSPTGRLTKKTSIGQNTNTETNYTYNTKGILVHEIGKSNGKDFRTTYQFDAYNRLIANYEITPDNINHQKGFTYDGYGRLHTETYNSYLANNVYVNSGRTIVYRYNTYNGMLEQYDNAVPGVASTLLWKLNDANEKMQVLSASLGNGMQITNTYDANDYVKTINHSDGTNTALNLEYQFKGDRGTLDYRKNTIPGVLSWDETFTYDSFERLESWTDPTGTAANSYETDGRIKTNDLVGSYNYDPSNRYRKQSASLNTNGYNLYQTRSPQTVTYNMFKNPTAVIEATRGRVNFEFNLDNTRSKSVVLNEAGTITKNKYYSSIYSLEIIEKPGQSLQFITYLGGSPYDAPMAFEKTYTISGTTYTPSTEEFLYLHRDYQGTILAISGNGGVIKERRQFDPWGVLKKYYVNEVLTPLPSGEDGGGLLTDRGYTGHEHFFSVGIIHMNGRIYDPVLRTFLSADPFIQDPSNSQNYNRYAYCWNNPLMYTDPSGNIAFLAVLTAGLFLTTNVIMPIYNGTFTWGGLAKSILINAAVAAVTFGVGSVASSIFTSAANTFLQGAIQGAVIGAITGVGGTVANAAFTGENLTLKTLIKGAVIGAATGAILGGIQGASNGKQISNACNKMGINPGDPVPATDEFLSEAQKNWFPDAPMDKVKNFSTENLSDRAKNLFATKPSTYAVTYGRTIAGTDILTGNSSIYFNPNTAFSSAKTLYMAMGHEFVHVSQYAALMGKNMNDLLKISDFDGMLEYHAYEFQHKILGDFNGINVVNDFQNIQYYNSMNYTNFNWTTNTSFNYPFTK